ncbi:hydrogen peroxide-inducible genes activator [Histidinibacterium lentulum]|uniref:Hydrogen peroxide-inducible genes activator n=1 Tax=Histidinibacterium lentulum TaxID=2480588 RepID=A0A3N2R7K9_9RHOB|nr:hydrogen peroxide-inducible genes activator [Histidinibacterium lentulum]ROU03361.1 hydrogen peroxide-inducible genes activator [Histidinibacterium lentulum]
MAVPPLTLRQIRYFVTLAETGHFGRAAEREGVSQPSLSQQISLLESALGVTLVERGRAGAMLTPAGREALARGQRLLDEAEGLADLRAGFRAGLGGTVRLGSTGTLGPYVLPQAVRRLHAAHPELKLVIRDGAPRDLVDGLRTGVHDLVLTQLPVTAPDVAVERLFREPLFLAVSREHILADRAEVTDADLAGEGVLSLNPAYMLHRQIGALADEVGARLLPEYEGTSLDALRQMVAMNMGVTFLPALYARSEITGKGDDVRLIPFRRGRLMRDIGLLARRSSGGRTGLGRLADVLRSVVAEEFSGLVIPLPGSGGRSG